MNKNKNKKQFIMLKKNDDEIIHKNEIVIEETMHESILVPLV